jgi:galactitol-specific phosphotransferase system IIC component
VYYETVISPALARRYWDAYNAGLVLAVLVVAVGSIINLARTSLNEQTKGRSQ